MPFRAKLAVQCFKKRFATKEPKVIALTLELLDLAMGKCGNPLHIQVCNKEFMNILVSFLNMKNLPQPVSKPIVIINVYLYVIVDRNQDS